MCIRNAKRLVTESTASKLSTIQFFFIELLSFCIYFLSNLFYILLSISPSPDFIFLASGSNEICAHKRNCLEKTRTKIKMKMCIWINCMVCVFRAYLSSGKMNTLRRTDIYHPKIKTLYGEKRRRLQPTQNLDTHMQIITLQPFD